MWSWHPVQLSLVVASIATGIVFVFAMIVAYWMTEKNVKGRAILETVVFLPLVLPPTVIGFLLIIIFGNNSFVGQAISWLTGQPLLFTVTAAVIAASVVAFPLMYQSLKTGFQMVDDTIRGAAKVDGASNGKLLFLITIPLSYRSIATGFILSFTRAFGEFGATLMFAGNIPGKTQTIPTAIYLAIESGQTTIATYYSLISISFSFVLLFMMNRLTRVDVKK
ncbi:Molybdenum transport system permease protein ModB [Virgibacillus dokdonensis]|uniref:Molybdenum transport system permease n=2 Tax=Virgibacillus dokdonensis TaxID=302167 RepID=A0A2K9J6S4_9BACI|nr:Molybdenum transport system permease protein ModB [Virgibacillus dokdonensis]